MAVFEVILRALDLAALWVIFSDKLAKDRIWIIGVIGLIMLLVNGLYLYLLNASRDGETATYLMVLMQITFFSIIFNSLRMNDDASVNQIDQIRKTYLVWIAIIIAFEQLLSIYALAVSKDVAKGGISLKHMYQDSSFSSTD